MKIKSFLSVALISVSLCSFKNLENNFMFVPGKLARKNGHVEYENYQRDKN